MSTPVTKPDVYDATKARQDFPTPWLLWGDCVDLCRRFGFSEWTFRISIAPYIDKRTLPCAHTRYSRESIFQQLNLS